MKAALLECLKSHKISEKVKSWTHMGQSGSQLSATRPEVGTPRPAKLANLGPKLDQGTTCNDWNFSHMDLKINKKHKKSKSRVPGIPSNCSSEVGEP